MPRAEARARVPRRQAVVTRSKGAAADGATARRAAPPTPPASDAVARIHAIVRTIPRGRVVTYGELAGLAGISSGHRVAARAMRSCPESLPWQRVLGKKDARRGKVAIDDPFHAQLQRGLLEREGVVFDANGFVPLQQYGWLMTRIGPADGARRGRKTGAETSAEATPRLAKKNRAKKKSPRRTPRAARSVPGRWL